MMLGAFYLFISFPERVCVLIGHLSVFGEMSAQVSWLIGKSSSFLPDTELPPPWWRPVGWLAFVSLASGAPTWDPDLGIKDNDFAMWLAFLLFASCFNYFCDYFMA